MKSTVIGANSAMAADRDRNAANSVRKPTLISEVGKSIKKPKRIRTKPSVNDNHIPTIEELHIQRRIKKEKFIEKEKLSQILTDSNIGFHLLPPEIILKILLYLQPVYNRSFCTVDQYLELPWSTGTTSVDLEMSGCEVQNKTRNLPEDKSSTPTILQSPTDATSELREFYSRNGLFIPPTISPTSSETNSISSMNRIINETSQYITDFEDTNLQDDNQGPILHHPTTNRPSNSRIISLIDTQSDIDTSNRNSVIFTSHSPTPSSYSSNGGNSEIDRESFSFTPELNRCYSLVLTDWERIYKNALSISKNNHDSTHEIFHSSVNKCEMTITRYPNITNIPNKAYNKKQNIATSIKSSSDNLMERGLNALYPSRSSQSSPLNESVSSKEKAFLKDIFESDSENNDSDSTDADEILIRKRSSKKRTRNTTTKITPQFQEKTTTIPDIKNVERLMPVLFALRTLSRNWYKASIMHPFWFKVSLKNLIGLPCCNKPVNFNLATKIYCREPSRFLAAHSIHIDTGIWTKSRLYSNYVKSYKLSLSSILTLLMSIKSPKNISDIILCLDWEILGEASFLYLIARRFDYVEKLHLEGANDEYVTMGFGNNIIKAFEKAWSKNMQFSINCKGKNNLEPINKRITHLGLGDYRLSSENILKLVRMCIKLKHLSIYGTQNESMKSLNKVSTNLESLTIVWGKTDIYKKNFVSRRSTPEATNSSLTNAVNHFVGIGENQNENNVNAATEENNSRPADNVPETSLFRTLENVLTCEILDTSKVLADRFYTLFPEKFDYITESKVKRIIINVREEMTENLLIEILGYFVDIVPKLREYKSRKKHDVDNLLSKISKDARKEFLKGYDGEVDKALRESLSNTYNKNILSQRPEDAAHFSPPLVITVFAENITYQNVFKSLLSFDLKENCGFQLDFCLRIENKSHMLVVFTP